MPQLLTIIISLETNVSLYFHTLPEMKECPQFPSVCSLVRQLFRNLKKIQFSLDGFLEDRKKVNLFLHCALDTFNGSGASIKIPVFNNFIYLISLLNKLVKVT